MSCESTSSLIVKLWNKYADEAQKIGCTAIMTLAGNPDPAAVTTCVEVNKLADEVKRKVISFWNAEIAKNSWAQIGPRSLEPGETETGTIQSVGDRTFITPTPITCDKVKLSLEETDGKGETRVDVCKMNTKGNCTKIKTWNFNEDADGRRGHGDVSLEIDDIKGKYLVVLLNGKDILRSFSYKIKLEKVVTAIAVKI